MSGYLSGRTSLTTVQTGDIAADAVTTAKIAPDAITAAEIGDNVLDSEHYAATSIDNEHLADDAVNAAEIGALSAALDINGQELILDADADTSITADTDDQIDFKIAGADDFRMTANNMNVLSGSTLTIDSGATITNSGTATNFGVDPESAYAGVLQTNANFVDQVIFGPSVDGRPWNGFWNKASLFSSLMLATIEDEGSNTEINIWDLTEQSAGVISTTPLATVDLASAATPTSIAAAMGYIIVGSEDGIHIIDPHDGSWAERTAGWPKTLSTSTIPALTNNDIQDVAATIHEDAFPDPRTGFKIPAFACAYGTGADTVSLIKWDGNVWDWAGTIGPTVVGFVLGRLATPQENSGNQVSLSNDTINLIKADDWSVKAFAYDGNAQQYFLGANADADFYDSDSAFADSSGVSFRRNDYEGNSSALEGGCALVTRTYNTGYLPNYTKGAWLANSKSADRSDSAQTMNENGTVTESAVASGAELNGYSGFTDGTNYLSLGSSAGWHTIGTGSCWTGGWFKCTAVVSGAAQYFISFGNAGVTIRFNVYIDSNGYLGYSDVGATAGVYGNGGQLLTDSVWHKYDFVRVSSTERYLYLDGVLHTSSTTDAGSLSDSGNLPLSLGGFAVNGGASCQNTSLSLIRIGTTPPNATAVRQMYEAEKGMFEANAECLLQSSSTDAVLDVNIDPLTKKVLVTQTDAITVFDGLVVDSKPTVNSGSSEKGKLFGDLRTEQNSANAYVTAPAVDQRQVNEMVRSLANELPKITDTTKIHAYVTAHSNGNIFRSYGVKSVTYGGAGYATIILEQPMWRDTSSDWRAPILATCSDTSAYWAAVMTNVDNHPGTNLVVYTRDHAGTLTNTVFTVVVFGEPASS